MWVLWGQGEVRQCGCCGVKVRSGNVGAVGSGEVRQCGCCGVKVRSGNVGAVGSR